jgi:hypothetical protein
MKQSAVIREVAAATEGPFNCKLRYARDKEAAIAGARSLTVCAVRDDIRFRSSLTSPSRI